MDKGIEQLQELDERIINGYFDSEEELQQLQDEYMNLKFNLMQNGVEVYDNINFSVMPQLDTEESDLMKLFGDNNG